jgi:hypothetical protein
MQKTSQVFLSVSSGHTSTQTIPRSAPLLFMPAVVTALPYQLCLCLLTFQLQPSTRIQHLLKLRLTPSFNHQPKMPRAQRRTSALPMWGLWDGDFRPLRLLLGPCLRMQSCLNMRMANTPQRPSTHSSAPRICNLPVQTYCTAIVCLMCVCLAFDDSCAMHAFPATIEVVA